MSPYQSTSGCARVDHRILGVLEPWLFGIGYRSEGSAASPLSSESQPWEAEGGLGEPRGCESAAAPLGPLGPWPLRPKAIQAIHLIHLIQAIQVNQG
jgi:hypothetical protein